VHTIPSRWSRLGKCDSSVERTNLKEQKDNKFCQRWQKKISLGKIKQIK
jgi:hypothetical protein